MPIRQSLTLLSLTIMYGYRQSPQVVIQQGYPVGSRVGSRPMPELQAVEGILVEVGYEPGRGDPVVVEQAEFRGEVVQMGRNHRETVNAEEAVVKSACYQSLDCKEWTYRESISMNVFRISKTPIGSIVKLKGKLNDGPAGHRVLKISCSNQQQHYLAFKADTFIEWFLRLVWARTILDKFRCEEYGMWGPEIEGRVFKKSEVLGDWEPRHVRISRQGLRSSKAVNSAISLEIVGTREIWTRFEEIKGGSFLVVKLWYGIIKEEFAVPVSNCLSWLYHFLHLLRPN